MLYPWASCKEGQCCFNCTVSQWICTFLPFSFYFLHISSLFFPPFSVFLFSIFLSPTKSFFSPLLFFILHCGKDLHAQLQKKALNCVHIGWGKCKEKRQKCDISSETCCIWTSVSSVFIWNFVPHHSLIKMRAVKQMWPNQWQY